MQIEAYTLADLNKLPSEELRGSKLRYTLECANASKAKGEKAQLKEATLKAIAPHLRKHPESLIRFVNEFCQTQGWEELHPLIQKVCLEQQLHINNSDMELVTCLFISRVLPTLPTPAVKAWFKANPHHHATYYLLITNSLEACNWKKPPCVQAMGNPLRGPKSNDLLNHLLRGTTYTELAPYYQQLLPHIEELQKGLAEKYQQLYRGATYNPTEAVSAKTAKIIKSEAYYQKVVTNFSTELAKEFIRQEIAKKQITQQK